MGDTKGASIEGAPIGGIPGGGVLSGRTLNRAQPSIENLLGALATLME